MKRRAAAVLLFLCLLAGTAAPARAFGEEAEKTITVMIYMCGSNLESGSGAASEDLMEMAASGYDAKKINLLVMTGGTRAWLTGLPTDSLCIYIPFRNSLRMVYAFESMSMGSPEALEALLAFGAEKYPADEYALILWNHGGGPMNGICWDELYDSDRLTMEELHTALSSSPFAARKLSWIGFDACLMASAETAFLMEPFASYMIASEETEPAGGWNYAFLKGLELDPDPAATARRIIDGYFEAEDAQEGLTLSCVDLSGMAELSESMDDFFRNLEVDGGSYAWFSYAARNTRSFGKALSADGGYDLMDLAGLVRRLEDQSPEKAERVLRALESAVVYSRSSDGSGRGLSVYHPLLNKREYAASWAELYPRLGLSESYSGYVARFAEYLFGQAAGLRWDGLRAAYTDTEGVYALPLSEAQREMLSSAVMRILQWDPEENAYRLIAAETRQEESDGVLYMVDSRQILVVADENGAPLTGALPYEILPDGSIAVYVNFCSAEAAGTEEAAALPDPGSLPGRKDFGFDDFEEADLESSSMEDTAAPGPAQTQEFGVISVPDSVQAQFSSSSLPDELAPVVISDVSPLQDLDQVELLAVPESVSLDLGLTGGTVSHYYPPAPGGVNIEPAQLSGESLGSRGEPIITMVGSPVPLDAFATVELSSFEDSQLEVNLTVFDPESSLKEQEPGLVHARMVLEPDGGSGELRIREISFYEPINGEWSSRLALNPEDYPVLSFPVEWKQPARAGEALAGFDRWPAVRREAYRTENGNLHLRFIPDESGRPDACVLFEITDIQSTVVTTLPIPCESPGGDGSV